MKIVNHRILFLALFFLVSCSENPVFKNEDVTNNSISGTVELSDQLTPDSVFVWFRVLDIGTRTDENGHFKLVIPSPNLQPGKGLDGLYAVYFYTANYILDSLEIPFSNGSVQISSTEVNDKGELKKHIKLQKLLEITASVDPPVISQTFQDTVLTTLTLKAYKEGVEVRCTSSLKTSKYDPEFLAGFLVDRNNNLVKYVRREDRELITRVFDVGIYPASPYPLMLKLEPGALVPGDYRIVPHFDIRQDNLPSGLIESLGENIHSYSQSYLKLPIKINGNNFQVIGD